MEDTPVLALKIVKSWVDVYLGPPYNGYALNCHFVFIAIPGTSIIYVKAKFVQLTYMKSQTMKCKSVQINMKQVSYYM